MFASRVVVHQNNDPENGNVKRRERILSVSATVIPRWGDRPAAMGGVD
jgi:hypothetical protein